MTKRNIFIALILFISLCGCSTVGDLGDEETKPPGIASDPIPISGAVNVWISPTLHWHSYNNYYNSSSYFDLFMDTISPPRKMIAANRSSDTITLLNLRTNTIYYWRVNVFNYQDTTIGNVWNFRTGSGTNYPPTLPANPKPDSGAVDISVTTKLAWSCSDPEGNQLTYDVYLGLTNPPTGKAAIGQSATTFSCFGLSYMTTYYWRVIAKDTLGATAIGPVWSFTTGLNHPPVLPSNPQPADGAIDISLSPSFSWSCSDPDNDVILYDLFLDTINPPATQVVSGQNSATFSYSGLAYSTTYYWRVNAKDNYGAATTGSVWSFKTADRILPVMLPVTGGSFQMGSSIVTINSFMMEKFEVTHELWSQVRNWGLDNGYTDIPVGNHGSNPDRANNPVTQVNWYDAVKWCNAHSEKDNLTPVYYTDSLKKTIYRTGQLDINVNAVRWDAKGYRLPTEAEWEFAARGGILSNNYGYSGFYIVGEVAWYDLNSGMTTHTVGKKTANELGLYDMSGNVFEWCWDWYADSEYPSGGTTDPKGPSTKQIARLVRGGSFNYYESYCRVSTRNLSQPVNREIYYGFRCVQD